MTNVIKFNRPKPKQPERKPVGPKKLTWQPWAIFAGLVVVVYVIQFQNPFG